MVIYAHFFEYLRLTFCDATNYWSSIVYVKDLRSMKNLLDFFTQSVVKTLDALSLMKIIATDVDPMNDSCYSKKILTSNDQYVLMCYLFPPLSNHCTSKQLQYWISKAKIWGNSERPRVNTRESGRSLWVVNEQLRAFVTDTSDTVKNYWRYLQIDNNIITIGYTRKSPASETDESRIQFLQLTANKLYFRGKCEEVYVSPLCKSDQLLLERNSPRLNNLISQLKGVNGDLINLVTKMHLSQRSFRLVIIDYAGLSTSPEDVKKFIKYCSNIQEVFIDLGSSFEVLSRFDLLNTTDIEKFNCRIANIKRSK